MLILQGCSSDQPRQLPDGAEPIVSGDWSAGCSPEPVGVPGDEWAEGCWPGRPGNQPVGTLYGLCTDLGDEVRIQYFDDLGEAACSELGTP